MNDDKTSSECNFKAEKKTTECSGELPVIAIVNERIEEGHLRARMLDKGDSICKVGDELVKRIDHEHEIAKERSRKFEEGFFQGMEYQKERFTELIKNKIENTEINPVDEEKAIKQSEVLQELLDEVQKPDTQGADVESTGRRLEEIHNNAIYEFSAEAEWHAMHDGNYVLKAKYYTEKGLEALREAGWEIYNIEASCLHDCDWIEEDPEPQVQIYVREKASAKEKGAEDV